MGKVKRERSRSKDPQGFRVPSSKNYRSEYEGKRRSQDSRHQREERYEGLLYFTGSEGAAVPKKSKTESRMQALAARKAARSAPKSALRMEESKGFLRGESSTTMVSGGSSILRPLSGAVKMEWEENEMQLDRAWYDQDEDGNLLETREGAEDCWGLAVASGPEEKEEVKRPKEKKEKRETSRYEKDNDLWEANRMAISGAFKKQKMKADVGEIDENRPMLVVREVTPPFLDGRMEFTRQVGAVQVVREVGSPFALLARAGSKVLREVRERRERAKVREKFWELAGSKIGNLMGVENEKEENQEQTEEASSVDYKADSQYAGALKEKTEAVSDFAKNKTLKEQREFLPVFTVKEKLLKVIRENKIVVIVGETGSGKTTQITQYLLEAGYGRQGMIGCTQPRRVAAVAVAKRVAEEMDQELGSLVGYAIRFEDVTTKGVTKIKYMTDGVLLRESLTDPDLEQYTVVVMDQAHERSLNTDVLFGLMRGVAARRRDLKLVITSATLDAEKFADFFGGEGVPIFRIPGRTFPVRNFFARQIPDDYVKAGVEQALVIHLKSPRPGDILIFMTGQEDIEATCVLLAERVAKLEHVPPLLVLPIYSQLPSDVQARIFRPSAARKCIVATNIAETSLTLDGVRYVVDTGLCKLKVFNPRVSMDALQVTPVSQANANQRAGRAGRTGPGECYRLYTDMVFRQELLESTVPQLQRTNLANVVLLLKSLRVENLLEFPFMDPPPTDTLLASMHQLWVLGALDATGELTPLGAKMAEFPVDPPLSRMLLLASQAEQNCAEEFLTIVSMLSVPALFFRPKGKETEADSAREKFFVPESDHLTLLHVYNEWVRHEYSGEWATQHYLHSKALRKVREIRAQLADIMDKLKLPRESAPYQTDLIRQILASSLFHHAARAKGVADYVSLLTRVPCALHPSSALAGLGLAPQFVVYQDLVLTSKEFMTCATAVEAEWLARAAPTFFALRYPTSHDPSRGSMSVEQETNTRQLRRAMELEMEAAMEQKRASQLRSEQVEHKERILFAGAHSALRPKTPFRSMKRGGE